MTPHVLCVDDDAGNRRVIARLLERAGCAVTCAENGLEALEAIKADPTRYDVVVTDHNMPVMTGLDLISELIEMAYPGKIILSSATIGPTVLAEFKHRSVIRILDKPVNARALISAVSPTEPPAPGA